MTSFTGQPSGVPGLGNSTTSQQVQPGLQFRTYPVPYSTPALYTLSIRGPSPSSNSVASFTFPLSPESLRKEYNALTNFYDVAGNNTNQGVQRIIDLYGITPCTFVIEGTTGWKLHSTDGYKYTGLQAAAYIEQLLAQWANLNQTQIAAGNNNPYELWFFDYFRNQFWSVVPCGPQGIRQTNARPILINYSFRLVGVYEIAQAQSVTSDSLSTTLSQPASQSAASTAAFGNSVSTTYAASTAPAA